LLSNLEKVKTGVLKMENVAKSASKEIRQQFVTSSFFRECLEILNTKDSKVYQLPPGKKQRFLDSMLMLSQSLKKLKE